jgi:hypothetical protein
MGGATPSSTRLASKRKFAGTYLYRKSVSDRLFSHLIIDPLEEAKRGLCKINTRYPRWD